ncbi:putative protein kinase RLK-Pelle-CrRLK1L-1 family [Helianthus annuus]|uniref:Protein kinase domain-containing protein n=1 Tax=Helianthus annuus TaxID=4232 RepID=A0A9K3N9J0_HELAN|nr:probable receptor-like protein kinase At2g23200 [Helianthus annuus]KAF5791630.1 putative protein kinase RLK-Pelle-CrRLK1L-1 family [Helianthus annuus]KAJ0526667.1 putative protein kinase RLK-Pelle-CrRLK1L-1 family [Helianthus annuus]KAJ0535175.1 putative protein kinase RLK-Pelle-CrRLK1L-1 family [Helianthus annuus]KAJ0543061.1 putative protein kinase RLK-Pelle-CrRLK1L-1 family [Helianthus annuus]KAJ0708114.1 putative protein kinase RLK-Pelle-CrRLK1L-1 family [Helianthus annuus]
MHKNSTSNTSEIYKTARVFTQKSWYELKADASNSFMIVRLHFSPFFSDGSKFDVSVSGFTLLSNFSVEEKESIVIRELIIRIRSHGRFTIEFTPSSGSSSAFVNAIEAFTAPSGPFMQVAPSPHISPAGYIGEMDNISSSYAFSPIYRVNIGVRSIDRDTLRRKWTPDDPFIFKSDPAKNVTLSGTFNHNEFWATKYDAPADVYKTAKELTTNSSVNNITWNFGVKKNAMYLVRAHFCDIISPGQDPPIGSFNFFIYGQYNKEINPGEKVKAPQIPFYYDFVVDSVESGFVNVSIGAIPASKQPVLLNGLEIMELLKNLGIVGIPKISGVDDIQNNGKKVVGCAVGVVVLVLLIGFFIWLKYQKRKPVVETKRDTNTVPSDDWSSCMTKNTELIIDHPPQILNLNLKFQFADILQATNSFDESLVIGKGGFGKVYKGALIDGKTVAVKRCEKGQGQGRPEFVKEIMVLTKIRHQHLVTLIGYCDEKSEMILVYEYMEKGTLQDHLCNTDKDIEKLSWSQRLEICIGATRGLHYLHTGLEPGIIHGDVKSTNILLNENYTAKVGDFGISRWDNDEESEMDIKGSFGYLDPEYVSCLKLTQKSDVYSFGVVLLEVLCARPALDNTLPFKEANLADWAMNHIKDGMVEKIVDPYLVDKINPNSLTKYWETVDKCLKNTGDERPSIYDVLWDLEYALKFQQMVVDKKAYEDSTMKTSLLLSKSMINRLPSKYNNDDSQVKENSVSSYPSESQVFSQLKIGEAPQ